MSILEVRNLTARFGSQTILDDISFSLEKGDALAIIGPNGAGKTTLFRAIIGAIPYEGEIIRKQDVRIGYVPQKIDLERDLPITVQEFFGLQNNKNNRNVYSSTQAAELVGLSRNYLGRRLSELSSGEFQRILIGWAVISKPAILLFDEPTSSIDIHGQETIYELLHRLQHKFGLTLLIISHDLAVVYKYAGKVLCLNHSQICYGNPMEKLTTQSLEKLYGNVSKFYEHKH